MWKYWKENGLKKAVLSGSVARGEATEESDIDLLVEFEGRKSLLDLSGLKLEIEEILGSLIVRSLNTASSLR